MKLCTLYLVRHGQTQWNVDQRIQGHTDTELTEIGEQQAHEQRMKLKNIHFSKIYSSDLIRTHKTAEILNLERNLALQTTQMLRERNFGSYQGRLIEEGRKKLWDLLTNYSDHPHIKESGVEIDEKVVGRVITFLREVSVAHPGETILIVTHGGVMRLILAHLGYIAGSISNLAYTILRSDGVDFFVGESIGITFSADNKSKKMRYNSVVCPLN